MNIADKLAVIADNQQQIYDAGKFQGYQNGHDDGINEGIEIGKTQEYWRFWNSFQQEGTRRNYINAFCGVCWRDDTYNPPYEIIATTQGSGMFQNNTMITTTKVPITISNTTNNVQVFLGCTRLKTIVSLKVTEKITAYTAWFSSCNALENITFTEDSVIAASINFQQCPLSVASMKSIIAQLKNYSGTDKDGTYTLTFSEDCWTALEADSDVTVGEDRVTWRVYVQYVLGWAI